MRATQERRIRFAPAFTLALRLFGGDRQSSLMKRHLLALTLLVCFQHAFAAEVLFEESFTGKLSPGWKWIREEPGAWRVKAGGLEVLVQPGNMWGGQNNARNLLVRPAPELTGFDSLEILVTVQNSPSHQFEQVNFVWYYDDSHMVKLGQELVDGQLSVVMGREEKDQTRTIAIVPLNSATVHLRAVIRKNLIQGFFRTNRSAEWKDVGECTLPAPPDGKPHLSIQCYQGGPGIEHWARITNLRVTRIEPQP